MSRPNCRQTLTWSLTELQSHETCKFWTDIGCGLHQLHFLRDKEKREVDFLITSKNRPFLSVEAKFSEKALGRNYLHFCKKIGLEHHIQIVHTPGTWSHARIEGIHVLQASADYVLPFFV